MPKSDHDKLLQLVADLATSQRTLSDANKILLLLIEQDADKAAIKQQQQVVESLNEMLAVMVGQLKEMLARS